MNFYLPFTVRACFQCLVLMAMIAGSNAAGPERIYAVQLQVTPSSQPEQERTKGMLTDVAREGYSAVILTIWPETFLLFEHRSKDRTEVAARIADVLRHAREHGLEPIFQVPMVAQRKKTGELITGKYPGIVYQGEVNAVWNPLFKLPDGRSIYDGVVFPLIDELVSAYGEKPPKYFCIGCDECDTGALRRAAQKENLTAGKLFAREINRVTSYLIKKNITPIMWGDMLLSKDLAKPGLVRGFPSDPRFAVYNTMNGDGTYWGGVSVMDGVDDIVNRDKIIIGDWHYSGGTPAGEYPSVDYFKKLGFKDVWGSTWFDGKSVGQFAKYAAARNCGGMIATTWFTTFPNYPLLDCPYRTILHNSIVYFKNPDVTPNVRPTMRAYGPGSGKTCLYPAGSKVTLVATPGDAVKIASEPVFSLKKHGSLIKWEETIPGKVEQRGNVAVIKATFAIPETDAPGKAYDVKLEYVGENQLLYQGYEEALFAVGK